MQNEKAVPVIFKIKGKFESQSETTIFSKLPAPAANYNLWALLDSPLFPQPEEIFQILFGLSFCAAFIYSKYFIYNFLNNYFISTLRFRWNIKFA